jgi:hypothetical protein
MTAVTGGPAGDWPVLTGEPSRCRSPERFQPVAFLSGGVLFRYFPDHRNFQPYLYIIFFLKWQGLFRYLGLTNEWQKTIIE